MTRLVKSVFLLAAFHMVVGSPDQAPTPSQDQCGEHAEWKKCWNPCHPTCDVPKPKSCPVVRNCVPGCMCKSGFVNDTSTNNCIKHEACPNQCKENEVYSQCHSSCPPTCDDPNPICTKQCVVGCGCKSGYVQDPRTKSCVPEESCKRAKREAPVTAPNSLQCGPNQVYTTCGSQCQPTCKRPKPGLCNRACIVGCICKKGYLRNSAGHCVSPDQCEINIRSRPVSPSACHANEEWKDCGTTCPPTCAEPNGPSICDRSCVSGCFCKKGLVRDANKLCIRPDQCQKPVDEPSPDFLAWLEERHKAMLGRKSQPPRPHPNQNRIQHPRVQEPNLIELLFQMAAQDSSSEESQEPLELLPIPLLEEVRPNVGHWQPPQRFPPQRFSPQQTHPLVQLLQAIQGDDHGRDPWQDGSGFVVQGRLG